jgi:hypothetical protein
MPRERGACDAKASLISKMSMSSVVRPQSARTAGIAYAGPTPISDGGTPTTCVLTTYRGIV